MKEPVIGIVICGFHKNEQFVPNTYIQSIRYAHGLPVLIPLVRSDHLLEQYIFLCDGFLFCGGNDITPLLFGEEPLPQNGKTNITVDLFQIRFMKRVLLSRKPLLAICRGLQILNVACGGTICQDLSLLPLSGSHLLGHVQQSDFRSDASHRVRTEPGSRLRQYLGSHFYVNSYHHQAVLKTGKDIQISARSQDGVIEAIELISHPFAIGVQWHPECMYRTSSEMRCLFHELIRHSQAKHI